MKRRKRILAGVTAAVMGMTLMGCANQEQTEDGAGTQVQEEKVYEGDFDQNGISKPGVLPISEEPITITAFISESSNISDITQHTVIKELEEKANVKLDFTVVPEDGAQEKLNMLLASGEYPEIIMGNYFTNTDLMKYGASEGILMPLNSLIEEQGVNLKERWEENPQVKEMMTAPDGNIYGIPKLDSGGISTHGAMPYKLWINTKWLGNVGMEMPTTTEEFREVLEAFKEQDANGNGDPNDEVPFTGAINTAQADVYLFLLNAFDYFNPDNGYLKLKDGTITGTANTDGIREGLQYLADLYEDGLIDPAALTQDLSQLTALGNREENVVGAAASLHVGMFVDVNNQERAAEYTALLPLTGPDGYCGVPYQTEASVSGASFVITDKCKNPEAAIKLADLFCGEEWTVRTQAGIKGEQWDDADEGTVGMDGETPAKFKYLSYTEVGSSETQDYKWTNTFRLVEPDWKGKFQVVGDITDPVNYEARLLQETIKMKPYAADAEDIPPFFLDDETGTELASMKTAIDDYVKSSIVAFISGEKTVENDWDDYLAGLEKLQYDRYIELNQKAYDDLKK